jgi:hypothetical protein
LIIRVISYLLYVLIAGAGIVLILDKVETSAHAEESVNPCSVPITYQIASIDENFDISETQLRRLISGAGNMWSNAAGHTLVEYDPQGDVKVHLIYDERQQLVEEERDFNNAIQMERLRFDRLHRTYLRHSEQYDEALERYNQYLNDYQQKVQEHNDEVSEWNEQGGAPDDVQERVTSRERELTNMQNELRSLQSEVNRAGRQLEDITDRLNEISIRKNGLIDEYNEQFAGEYRFSQGDYMNTGTEQRINIYHYKSINHLRLVLAHELGHALGLGHVESPGSVMYPVVESHGTTEITLSDQDVAAIQARCGR